MEGRHQLAAIVFTDAVGSTESMREDQERTLGLLAEDLSLMREVCTRHGGEVLKSNGDGLMMLFGSAADGVLCALEIQQKLGMPEKAAMQHRIGIHLGDVFVSAGDAHGDGVNVAFRLQEIAQPGAICLSRTLWDVARSRVPVEAKALGMRELKGILEPVEVFEIQVGAPPKRKPRPPQRLTLVPAVSIVAVAAVLITAMVVRPWRHDVPNQIQVFRSGPAKVDPAVLAQAVQAAVAHDKVKIEPASSQAKPDPKPAVTPVVDSKPDPASDAVDTDKMAEAAENPDEGAQAEVQGHASLSGYVEESARFWATRDFQGMLAWMAGQPWIDTPQGSRAKRHWEAMSNFVDWYQSQMRLYTRAEPLTIAPKGNTGQVTAWMNPGDGSIGVVIGSGKTRKIPFEKLPVRIIGMTYPSLLADASDPAKVTQGYKALATEARNRRTQTAASANDNAPSPSPTD